MNSTQSKCSMCGGDENCFLQGRQAGRQKTAEGKGRKEERKKRRGGGGKREKGRAIERMQTVWWEEEEEEEKDDRSNSLTTIHLKSTGSTQKFWMSTNSQWKRERETRKNRRAKDERNKSDSKRIQMNDSAMNRNKRNWIRSVRSVRVEGWFVWFVGFVQLFFMTTR